MRARPFVVVVLLSLMSLLVAAPVGASASALPSVAQGVQLYNEPPVLDVGDQGAIVSFAQESLNDVTGIGPIQQDGMFGPRTKAAVVQFQTEFGLVPDGVVGPHTWPVLLAKGADHEASAQVPTPGPLRVPPHKFGPDGVAFSVDCTVGLGVYATASGEVHCSNGHVTIDTVLWTTGYNLIEIYQTEYLHDGPHDSFGYWITVTGL